MQGTPVSNDLGAEALWGDCVIELLPLVDPFIAPTVRTQQGVRAQISESESTFIMRSHCSCFSERCAWCVKDMNAASTLSHHEKLKHLAEWQSLGYEDGEGAPNIFLSDGTALIRIWLHRTAHYRPCVRHTLASDEVAEAYLTRWVRSRRCDFAIASLDRWAGRARHLIGYARAKETRDHLVQTLTASPEPDLDLAIRDVRKAILPL
jgi:hypothetical protein